MYVEDNIAVSIRTKWTVSPGPTYTSQFNPPLICTRDINGTIDVQYDRQVYTTLTPEHIDSFLKYECELPTIGVVRTFTKAIKSRTSCSTIKCKNDPFVFALQKDRVNKVQLCACISSHNTTLSAADKCNCSGDAALSEGMTVQLDELPEIPKTLAFQCRCCLRPNDCSDEHIRFYVESEFQSCILATCLGLA